MDSKISNSKIYDNLIELKTTKEYCYYCKGLVKETYDLFSLAPDWSYGRLDESVTTYINQEYDDENYATEQSRKIGSFHKKCFNEMEKAKFHQNGIEIILQLEFELNERIHVLNTSTKNQNNRDDVFTNNGSENWCEITNDKITKLHLNLESKIAFRDNIPEHILYLKDLTELSMFNISIYAGKMEFFMSKLVSFPYLRTITFQFKDKFRGCLPFEGIKFNQVENLKIISAFICSNEPIFNSFSNLKTLELIDCTFFYDWTNIPIVKNLEFLRLINNETRNIEISQMENFKINFLLFPNIIELSIKSEHWDDIPGSILGLKKIRNIELEINKRTELLNGSYQNYNEFLSKNIAIHNGSESDKELINELISSGQINNFLSLEGLFVYLKLDLTVENIPNLIKTNKIEPEYLFSKLNDKLEILIQKNEFTIEQKQLFLQLITLTESYTCLEDLNFYASFAKMNCTIDNIFDRIIETQYICYFYYFYPDILSEAMKKESDIIDIDMFGFKKNITNGKSCIDIEEIYEFNDYDDQEDKVFRTKEILIEFLEQIFTQTFPCYYASCKKSLSYYSDKSLFEEQYYEWGDFGDGISQTPNEVLLNYVFLEEDLSNFKNSYELGNFLKIVTPENVLERCFALKSVEGNLEDQEESHSSAGSFLWRNSEIAKEALQEYELNDLQADMALEILSKPIFENLLDYIKYVREEITQQNVYEKIKAYDLNKEFIETYENVIRGALNELGATEQEINKIFFIFNQMQNEIFNYSKWLFFKVFTNFEKLLDLLHEKVTLENFFTVYERYFDFLCFRVNIMNLVAYGCQIQGATKEEISTIVTSFRNSIGKGRPYLSGIKSFEEVIERKRNNFTYIYPEQVEKEGLIFSSFKASMSNNSTNEVLEALGIRNESQENLEKIFEWIVSIWDGSYRGITESHNIVKLVKQTNLNNILEKMRELRLQREGYQLYKKEIDQELKRLGVTREEEEFINWLIKEIGIHSFKGIKDVFGFVRGKKLNWSIIELLENYKKAPKTFTMYQKDEEGIGLQWADELKNRIMKKLDIKNENEEKGIFLWIEKIWDSWTNQDLEKNVRIFKEINMDNILEKLRQLRLQDDMRFYIVYKDEIEEELKRLEVTEEEHEHVEWIINNEELSIFNGIKDIITYIRDEITIENVFEKYKEYKYSILFYQQYKKIFEKLLVKKGLRGKEKEILIEILKYKHLEDFIELDEVIKKARSGKILNKDKINDRRYEIRKLREISILQYDHNIY